MTRRPLLLIILLAAALRIALLACAWDSRANVSTPDTRDYVKLSDSLLSGSFDHPDPRDIPLVPGQPKEPAQPEIFRTPGYPMFLLLGTAVDQPNWWRLVLIVQVGVDVLLVYLTYLLACVVFGPEKRGQTPISNDEIGVSPHFSAQRAALWAAAFQATSAIAVASSMRILSDGLFTMLLTLALLLFAHHWKFARRWSLIACAAVLAAACYVRPTGQVFAVVLAAALLLRAARAKWGLTPISSFEIGVCPLFARPRYHLKSFALFVLVSAAVLAPWVVRNAVKADYVGFSSFASDSVYFYAAPEVLVNMPSEKQGQTPFSNNENGVSPRFSDSEAAREYMQTLDQADETAHGPRTPGQAVRFRQAYASKLIDEHFWLYAKLHVKGVVGFFLPGATDVLEIAGMTKGQRGTSDVLRKEGVAAAVKHYFGGTGASNFDMAKAISLTVAIVVITALQYLGVVLFLVRRVRKSLPSIVWILLAMIPITALLSGPYGFPRYQTMIVPLLSIFAAAGLSARWASTTGHGASG